MKQSIENLTENEKKFLELLLEKGNISDADIAKKTGMSKSTCSRIRKKMEKLLISEYIPIIELDKVGIEVFLVLLFKWNSFDKEDLTKKTFHEFEKDPHVIFLANGQGSAGQSTVMFMGFKSLEQYNEYFKEFRKKYDKYIENVNSLILPSKELIKHDFTEIIKKELLGVN
ncbi:Lrp/AsnC family transcriptional regulator [Candidatus Woesearchaeota archaeon]|nr:Lrp/AsnC family transcriptional regulator [Candidatus Woesearchaeota archaeon]